MTNTMNDDPYLCPKCSGQVQQDDDFCVQCGELFVDHLNCSRHPAQKAAGACIVCALPFCSECGGNVHNRFLCRGHEMLEIIENMVRVFGTSDAVQAEFAKSSLETAGLHPFLFSRKASPLSIGGPDYTLYRAAGDYDGHIINEFKVMVPCQEFTEAAQQLRDLGFMQ